MIPVFPKFKPLELGDKADVEAITGKYPPYSDFNFTSMWCWNIKEETEISQLNKNLVVRFSDYITGEPFYSYLGSFDTNDTSSKLISQAVSIGICPVLKLIPEDSVKEIDREMFTVVEEPDHFDYVYSTNEISKFDGSAYKKQRQLIRIFAKKYSYTIKQINLADQRNHILLSSLLKKWVDFKKIKYADQFSAESDTDFEFQNELTAFSRLLSSPRNLLETLDCTGVFVGDSLLGFFVNEKVSNGYCICHFGKANLEEKGIMPLLTQESSKHFLNQGFTYYNDEQDLGLASLKSSKSSYKPIHFLKKFTIVKSKLGGV